MGFVPTITVDKTDGLQMYISKESMQVEIVSAKSSALNVVVPKSDGEYVRNQIIVWLTADHNPYFKACYMILKHL